jgi:hypothetical protein
MNKANKDKRDHKDYIPYIQETTDHSGRLTKKKCIHTIHKSMNKMMPLSD